MFYESVFLALERKNVRYLVAGGVAVNLHGIPRMTADLDLLVDFSEENAKKFLEAMKELGYVPRLPVSAEDLLSRKARQLWKKEKKLHAFTFWNKARPFEEIDVLLDSPEGSKIFLKGKKIKAGKLVISVISLEDLISMKRRTKRKQDKADVQALELLKSLKGEK